MDNRGLKMSAFWDTRAIQRECCTKKRARAKNPLRHVLIFRAASQQITEALPAMPAYAQKARWSLQCNNRLKFLARLERFELPAGCLEGICSIHLSYGRTAGRKASPRSHPCQEAPCACLSPGYDIRENRPAPAEPSGAGTAPRLPKTIGSFMITT